MSKLLDLARAGYEFEKTAEEKDTLSRKAARVGGALAGGRFGSDVGATVGEGVGMGLAKAFSKTRSAAAKAILPKGIGGAVGAVSGLVLGAKAGHGLVKDIQKKANLLTDTAKGIFSVGKNLVKQNPTAAKAALGGAVAGAAATKALQTKQAEEKKPYGVLRHARDAALTGIDAYAGKAAGGMISAATSPHQIGGHLHTGRIGFGKGLGMAAGAAIGVANSIGRREAHQKYASSESVEKKPEAKPGKEGVKAESSLIASAKAEMAKAASKK